METDPQARVEELQAKLAKRERTKGYERNCVEIRKEIDRLGRVVSGEIPNE